MSHGTHASDRGADSGTAPASAAIMPGSPTRSSSARILDSLIQRAYEETLWPERLVVDSMGFRAVHLGGQRAVAGHLKGPENEARPHRGLQLAQPVPHPGTAPEGDPVARRDILGGIVHEYERAA